MFSRGSQLLSVEVKKVLTPAIQSALVRGRVGRVHHLLHNVGVYLSIDGPAFFAVLLFLSESAYPATLQKYLRYLIAHDAVQGDMFLVAIAYNGGPGNLAKWQRKVSKVSVDPLMFIESIPARETRQFVERVLANLWVYRERLNQPAPSLDAIAAGERPIYKSVDDMLLSQAGDARN